ncbi:MULTISPECIES: putative quinol monooxygenase [Gordonia]|uniref:Antibiotic biosynthesis monooxygenase n=1 Tax=Gordonia tangerina TaxID=2911060 RepID=A0ABS9DPL8_9ACTN|nr:antibiotic biosynthesis monooxygenase family protein [Gordonia tangerina]MCF3941165.1 antibiotic biosynthesis monooxygenase [Gordonia tangerina]
MTTTSGEGDGSGLIIIAGHELVDAEIRDETVAAYRDLIARARDADGCIHASITADSVDPERIITLEIWRDAAALNRWRRRARGPKTAKPTVLAVARYDAVDTGRSF